MSDRTLARCLSLVAMLGLVSASFAQSTQQAPLLMRRSVSDVKERADDLSWIMV